MKYKLRMFGSSDCEKCSKAREALDLLVKYDYIDGNADDTQDLCDFHDVDQMPHYQIVENRTNRVVHEEIQPSDLSNLLVRLTELNKQKLA